MGMAFRETFRNLWSGLSRYEYKTEADDMDPALSVKRHVHILSAHANYQPVNSLVFTARYAAKRALENTNMISSSSSAHLVSGRVTYDIDSRWDTGFVVSSLFSSGFRSHQYGLGSEVGRVLKENLWLSVGYNFFGFSDKDLSGENYTNRGLYMRLRFKFDENLFAGRVT